MTRFGRRRSVYAVLHTGAGIRGAQLALAQPPALEFSPEIDGEWWVPGGRSAAVLWQVLLRTLRNCVPKDTVSFEVPHCLWSR
jgi:hypothetical protein